MADIFDTLEDAPSKDVFDLIDVETKPYQPVPASQRVPIPMPSPLAAIPFPSMESAPTIPAGGMESFLPFEKLRATEEPKTIRQAVGQGLWNLGLAIPEFATSTAGMAGALTGGIAPRATAGYFASDMLWNAIKDAPQLVEEWNKMSGPQQVQAGINVVGSLGMAALLGVKAARGWLLEPRGLPSATQREIVTQLTEMAQTKPEAIKGLLDEVVRKPVPVPQRLPGPEIPTPPLAVEPSREQVPEGLATAPPPDLFGARTAVEQTGVSPEAARTLPAAAAEASKARAEEALAAGVEKVTEAGAKIDQPAAPLSGPKLQKEFRQAFDSLDEQTRYDVLSEMGYDVDPETGRFYMTDRDNNRLFLTGEQLADAKREFIKLAKQPAVPAVEPEKGAPIERATVPTLDRGTSELRGTELPALSTAVKIAEQVDPNNTGPLLQAFRQVHSAGYEGADALKGAWSLYAATAENPAIKSYTDFKNSYAVALEVQMRVVHEALKTKGATDAQRIREDTRLAEEAGKEPEGGKADRRDDLQQAAPGQPEPVGTGTQGQSEAEMVLKGEPTPAKAKEPTETVYPISFKNGKKVDALGREVDAQNNLVRKVGDVARELADRLEDLKLGEPGEVTGGLYGLTKAVWNTAVYTAQTVLRAGGSVADAIEAAIRYIRENSTGDWNERGVRKVFDERLVQYTQGKSSLRATPEAVKAEHEEIISRDESRGIERGPQEPDKRTGQEAVQPGDVHVRPGSAPETLPGDVGGTTEGAAYPRKWEAELRTARLNPKWADWEAKIYDLPTLDYNVRAGLFKFGAGKNELLVELAKEHVVNATIRSLAKGFLETGVLHFPPKFIHQGLIDFTRSKRVRAMLDKRNIQTADESFLDQDADYRLSTSTDALEQIQLIDENVRSRPDRVAMAHEVAKAVDVIRERLSPSRKALLDILIETTPGTSQRTIEVKRWSEDHGLNPLSFYNTAAQLQKYIRQQPEYQKVLLEYRSTEPISVGPGAQSAGAGPYSAAQQLVDQLKSRPAQGVKESIGLGTRIADKWAEGKSALTRAVARGQVITQSLKQTYRGVRTPTDVDGHVASLDWALQRSAAQSKEIGRAILAHQKNRSEREGVAIWIDAGGNEEVIRNVAANLPAGTPANVRRALEIAGNLPPRLHDFVNEIQQYYGLREQDAVSHEIFEHGLADYYTHVWKRSENMPDSLRAAVSNGRVSTYFKNARQRKIPTILEGIMQGRKPVLDPAGVIANYNYALDRAIASRQFIADLSQLRTASGAPIFKPSGTTTRIPADDGTQTIFIDPTAYKASDADYRAIDHPALRKWNWKTTTPEGTTVFGKDSLLVHKDYYDRLANFMDRGRLSTGPAMATALRVSAEVKGFKLGLLSPFHQFHVGTHALWHWTAPGFKAFPIDWEAPATRFAVEKGHLKLAANPHELAMFSEGAATTGLAQKIPVIGQWSRIYSEWLFGEYIPGLKLKTFENALDRNMKWYAKDIAASKITADEVAARVGDSVNNAYGELNHLFVGKNGRNPITQKFLRLLFLAPDFGEARLRFTEKAFTRYGMEERLAFLTMVGTMWTAARVANWMTHGDPETDLKNAFRVKVGDQWVTMRSVAGDIVHALTAFQNFAYMRANPILSRTAMDFYTGRDFSGRKLTTEEKFIKRPVEQLLPIHLAALTRDDQALWQSAVTAFGIQIIPDRPAQDVSRLVKDWMGKQKDPQLAEKLEQREQALYPPSPYVKLRVALRDGKAKAAEDIYRELLRTGHKPERIEELFRPTHRTAGGYEDIKPLSGLTEPEWNKFLGDITPAQRKMVTAAIRDRYRIWNNFQRIIGAAKP